MKNDTDLIGPVSSEEMLREIDRTIRDRSWKYPRMVRAGKLAIIEAQRRNRAINAIRSLIIDTQAAQRDLFRSGK